jgi:hypothetical protein
MGRRDEYDDDEDDRGRRPAKRGGVPPGVWGQSGFSIVKRSTGPPRSLATWQ